ncbi:hypothetical protein AB4Z19_15825 [Pseudoduganella sp. RAF19]|uniref:hypothetical protein n=1 Tax=Pseudoduganella sp. RAF19 TaxID=3233052 RepID=UPI003F94C26C
MANKFQITISAVDRATGVVRRVNASMSRLTRPVVEVGKSVRNLVREAGIDKFGQRLMGVGRAAVDVTGKLGGIAGPLGILVGGSILAGIVALTLEWGRLGAEVDRTARSLDISATELQSLRGAAAAAGVGSQELSGGLKSLGDTLEDALFGRNQQALVVLNRLGVGIHHTRDGSIDAARAMRDLSASIVGIKNVQVQGVIARTFGLESVLPLLRQGPVAIAAYERKVAELGGVMGGSALHAAEDFELSLNYLSVATQGVKNSIGAQLLPVLQPLIERFTVWIAANRELIATKVGDFVGGLVQRLNELDFQRISDDVHGFVTAVDDAVESVGGWKNAAIGLVVVMNGSLIASVINLGLAMGSLGASAVPLAIRSFALLAAAADATLVPAILKATLKMGLYMESLAVATAGVPVLSTVLSGLSAAFLATGAAIAATPIGWLIAGIAAIAFGVYAIYKNWDAIGAYFSKKIQAVRNVFEEDWIGGVVKALWEFSPVKIIGDAMNGLSKWLFDFDLYDAGKRVVAGLVRGIKSVASLLPKSLQRTLGIDGWAQASVATAAPAAAAAVPRSQAVSVPTAAAAGAVQTSAQPLGVRNNNPGNLRSWGNTPRDAGGYAVFPTMEAGLNAAVRNLVAQQKVHGLNTISGIIGKWAPPSENNTTAYISDLSRRTGYAPNQALNLDDPKVVAPLISGIVRHEGNSSGVTEEMINRVVAAQLSGGQGGQGGAQKMEVALTLHGLPAGTSATARTRGGENMPVRVAYTMPTGLTP